MYARRRGPLIYIEGGRAGALCIPADSGRRFFMHDGGCAAGTGFPCRGSGFCAGACMFSDSLYSPRPGMSDDDNSFFAAADSHAFASREISS